MTGRAGVRRRLALIATLLVGAVLLTQAGRLWQQRSRTIDGVRVVHVSNPAARLPAAQIVCPRRVRPAAFACPFTAPRASSLREVLRYFPGARFVDGYGEGPTRAGPATEIVRVRDRTQTSVTVMSRCAPGGDPVPDSAPTAPAATGPARLTVLAGAAEPGCSVAVSIDVPAGVRIPLGPARQLAHDPVLVLTP